MEKVSKRSLGNSESSPIIPMKEKALLIVNAPAKGEPIMYQCSLCGLIFRLGNNRTAREAMAELWAAFQDHVRETHAEPATSLEAQ